MIAERFDSFGTGVLDGRKLIESSAGTGKTYTIASLYVRLLIEKEMQVGQILVVTFTKAATEELKGRIRKNLRDMLSVLEGAPAEDDFISKYHDELMAKKQIPKAAELLANALRMFDEAAIFTIHGFCGRVLKDNAFESASLFDTELVTDGTDLIEEIAADFYRKKIHGALTPYPMKYLEDPLRHFIDNGLSPRDLAQFIRDHAAKPFLSILPGPEDAGRACRSIGEVEAGFEKAREDTVAVWRKEKSDIMARIGDGTLTRRSYTSKVREKMEARMDALAEADPSMPDFTDIERFRPAVMAEKNKGNPVPHHPFFDAFETFYETAGALRAIYTAPVIAMRHELLAYANAELDGRKKRKNIRFYDDLLQDLQKALASPGRAVLIERVRTRYIVGLIDEFQDTDLLQYEIFDAFFPAGSTLFLIGDPKQAIYSFRGADIFAYLKAAGNVEGRYSLGENFRSTPEMVRAVNALFGSDKAPFVFEQIDYPPVRAAEKGKSRAATRGGVADRAPLKFRFMSRLEGYKPGSEITKDRANREIPVDTASEIVALLEDGRKGLELLDGKKVVPGDVAVLVRTNRQARDIHAALRKRGVPAVIYGSESVFRTREALELQRVLSAVVDPGNDAKVRAALVTAWFGVDCAGLMRLQDDEAGWTEWILRFMGWRGEWASDGFVVMGRSMMRQAGIRKKMLGLEGGDRRLTNLLHLFELLHEVEHAEGLGIEGLAAWLARRRTDAADDEAERRASPEENQLRLETDEMAVKVVTVHKSKGLEYPVVFCPYLWDVYLPADLDRGVLCHDPGDTSRMVRDFGSSKFGEHAAQALKEDLSENARVLYVALTRAKYRCVVTWGAFKGAPATALAKLLHQGGMPGTDEEITAALQGLTDRSGTIAWETMGLPRFGRFVSESVEARTFACRPFSGRIDRDWGVSSFTGLVSGAGGKGERPDRDERVHVPAPPDAPRSPADAPGVPTPFDFPKGARSGLFFHALMESIDFAAGDDAIREAVKGKLPEVGLGPEWTLAASAMVRNALSTPLDDKDPGWVLSGVTSGHRRHEIEFGLSLGRLTLDALRAAYDAPGIAETGDDLGLMIRQLAFPPVRGLMKGYIDLVFERGGRYYLLDWKTNHLGGRIEDYAQDSLKRSMAESFYFLQSHLYTVALDRYLSHRIKDYEYERHFGGIFYLYVRGMEPSRGPAFGVYYDRPALGLVSALSRCIRSGA